MSAIFGFIQSADPSQSLSSLEGMAEKLLHRGPDEKGFAVDDNHGLGFGTCLHRISTAYDGPTQPISSQDQKHKLVFSGAITNRQSLKEELLFFGHSIEGETDPGLILAAYQAWGKNMVKKLDGFFAFALWDDERGELFMARDRFGVEPFYYSQHTTDGSFVFASEIKAFLAYPAWKKEINPDALRPYLSLQYPATKETFFRGAYKLPPATAMTYRQGQLESFSYWTYHFDSSESSFDEAVCRIQEAAKGAIDRYRAGLNNYGSFLSGGIDSSYIVALSKPEKSFTVGFRGYEGQFNESVYGEDLANRLGIKHHVRLLTAEECFEKLPTIQYHLDEPQANLSTIPLYFLSEMAAQHVDVVLSGEGADELFGGYDSYRDTETMMKYKKLPLSLRRRFAKLGQLIPNAHIRSALERAGQSLEESFVGEAKIFSDEQALALLKPNFHHGPKATDLTEATYDRVRGQSELNQKQAVDLDLFMPEDVLLKADKMTAAHGLQVRAPFLDQKVVEVAESLPESFRVQGLTTKLALRTAALASLPEEWANRPKAGFMVPMKDWLRQEAFAQKVRTIFSRPYVSEFFDQARLLRYLDAHVAREGDYQRKIYTVLAFLIWYEEYFVKR